MVRLTPVTDVNGNALARPRIHGDPPPLLVGIFCHKASYLISFGIEPLQDHIGWPFRPVHMYSKRDTPQSMPP